MTDALRVMSPYDGTLVSELPYDQPSEIESKLAAARASFDSWKRVPLSERARRVGEALGYFSSQAETIARDLTLQMGKPITESRREVDTLLDRARHMVEISVDSLAPVQLPPKEGFRRRIEHVPHGVVLDIAAWNYPLLIPVNVIVPALLAGNTVLLKHSGKTPLCGIHFERAFEALGEGVVSNLILSHDETARVIGDSRIAHVSFTGSVDGGHSIYRAVAERFVEAGLELGGKDPAYVAEDADLEFAVASVVDGACYNAGQSCCAVERIYVHRRHYDDFLAKAREVVAAYRLGDPLRAETTMGPLASRSALTFLEGQVKDAVGRGARLLAGGERVDPAGGLFAPTLLADVDQAASVMQEESFGPLVPVRAVDGDEEAIRLMNDSPFGLTASVWTADPERAERIAVELDTGTVYQNRCDYLDPALPWTGVGDSGKGSTLSSYGFLHLTRRKSIHFRVRT